MNPLSNLYFRLFRHVTYHVADHGSDRNLGTSKKRPFKTVTKAVKTIKEQQPSNKYFTIIVQLTQDPNKLNAMDSHGVLHRTGGWCIYLWAWRILKHLGIKRRYQTVYGANLIECWFCKLLNKITRRKSND